MKAPVVGRQSAACRELEPVSASPIWGIPTTPAGAELGPVSTSADPGVIVIVHVKFGEVCPATSVTETINDWFVPAWAASRQRHRKWHLKVRLYAKGKRLG